MADPKLPKCHRCGAGISGARTIIDSKWTCPACTYVNDYPDKEIIPVSRVRSAPIQKETLFPLPASRPKSG